jgi:hypothetical protein
MPLMANGNFEPRVALYHLTVGWRAKCERIARVAQSAAESWKATGGRGARAVSSAIKQNEESRANRALLKSRRGSCIRDGLCREKSTT